MNLFIVSVVVALACINSMGQIFLVKANLNRNKRFFFLGLGYGLFVISVITMQFLMNYIEFKTLSIVISLNLLAVMFASVIFLKEKLTRKKVIGTLIVFFGSCIYLLA
jgi:drug/metabolite transporter (DMT)-like permease